MALDVFEVFGINGQVLKFLVDKDNNNQLTLLTQTSLNLAGGIAVNNFPASQVVSGSVSVSNFPALQNVNVSNFPSIQTVSGTVRANGNLAFFPARFNQTGTSGIIRNAATRLLAFKIENLNTAGLNRFLILFNQITVPTANQSTNIIDVFNIPANQVLSLDSAYFSQEGIGLTGLSFGWSTNRSQFVAAASADFDSSFVVS